MSWRWVRSACLLTVLVAGACGDDDVAVDDVAIDEVAACDDLRRRENELIAVVNDALGELAAAETDLTRAEAVVRGFDRLIALADDQVSTITTPEPDITRALVSGAETAVAELQDERDRFVAEVDVVSAADEHGRAGQLQNALEKAFSDMEPPRAVYADAGLAEAIDADPDCRFVTQRADPAG